MQLALARLLGRGQTYVPGLLTAGVLALAAAFVSEHYGGPVLLYGLFFGMAFNFLADDSRVRHGIDLAARGVLRVGVTLLGVRITLVQIAELGVAPVLLVILGVVATIAIGLALAKALRRPSFEGVLTGGAVAICGASAALALAAVLPRTREAQRMTLFTVVGVTALSTLAMILYPAIVKALGLTSTAAGIFLGGTIHDVAQVVAAGYIVSPAAGDAATVIKLLRILLLVPVVALLSLAYRDAHRDVRTGRAPLVPWFLVAFLALVVVNSFGGVPASVAAMLSDVSRGALVFAICALGVKTSFKDLASLGWQPLVLMVGETVFLATVVLVGVLLIP